MVMNTCRGWPSLHSESDRMSSETEGDSRHDHGLKNKFPVTNFPQIGIISLSFQNLPNQHHQLSTHLSIHGPFKGHLLLKL